MIVIVDDSKLVDKLGTFPLPVEILPFAYRSTIHQISLLDYQCTLRQNPQGKLFITDNGNYIVDITTSKPYQQPEEDQIVLKSIPGVMETGLFLGLAGRVIIGHSNGTVDII